MANYANLKSDIAGVIRTNNNEEITGDILQEQLFNMVDELGAGYQYIGIAVPTTNPGSPDANVFYIASTAGTYTNFGGAVVADGEVAILKYNGSWTKEVSGAATAAQVTQLGRDVEGMSDDIVNLQQEVDAIQPIVIEGNVTNAPDEEDLTTDENDLLKFANRSTAVNQMGYVILRKNKTFAEQVTLANTIYEIRYPFDLGGVVVNIPAGCVLKFNGGMLRHGTLVGNSTKIEAPNYQIFQCLPSVFRGYYVTNYYDFQFVEKNDGIVLSGTWDNKVVCPNWCGLPFVADGVECSRAINNHLILYSGDVTASIPSGAYTFYGRIQTRRFTDLLNSELFVIEDYSSVEDSTIEIPAGATATPLRSVYGAVGYNYNNGFLKNFVLNCNADVRVEPYSTFNSPGVVSGVDFANSNGGTFENITILNAKQSGISSASVRDCSFINIVVENCGEHGFYMHFNGGSFSFKGCRFIDYSNDQEMVTLRGACACIRLTGPTSSEYNDDYASASLSFSDCEFSASLDGRFCFGPAPGSMTFDNCTFGQFAMCQIDGSLVNTETGGNVQIAVRDCHFAGERMFVNSYCTFMNARFYHCDGLMFDLMFDSATDCDFVGKYVGVVTYEHSTTEIVIERCNLSYVDFMALQYTTTTPLSIIFRDCYLDVAERTNEHRNSFFFSFNGIDKLVMERTTIDFAYTLLRLNGSALKKVVLDSCLLRAADTINFDFFKIESGVSNASFFCTNTSVDDSINLNGWGIKLFPLSENRFTKVVTDIKFFVWNRYLVKWRASLSDGQSTNIPKTNYYTVGMDGLDLSKYLTVIPVGNFTNFTTTINNNGSSGWSKITINNGSATPITYDFVLDFRNYPL